MNVLSVFDGMSCAQIALERAGVTVDKYYASEVDKYAIKVTQANFPDTVQIGDISRLNAYDLHELPKIDLMIGGSPCQGFSFAGKQLNFDDERSQLFFHYIRLLKYLKPRYFLLENVKMKKEFQDVISELLGVEPIEINSALVSAQNRKRLYWTNIPDVKQPEDKGIMLKDIIHEGDVDRDKSYCIDRSYYKGGARGAGLYFEKSRRQIVFETLNEYIVPYDKTYELLEKEVKRGKVKSYGNDPQSRIYQVHGKVVGIYKEALEFYLFGCITPDRINKRQNGQRFSKGDKFYTLTTQDRHGILIEGYIRKLTPIECERLQTVPYGYTEHVSNTQRYKMLGNGFTVDVIAHILGGIEEEAKCGCRCENVYTDWCPHCQCNTVTCNCNPRGTCMCS